MIMVIIKIGIFYALHHYFLVNFHSCQDGQNSMTLSTSKEWTVQARDYAQQMGGLPTNNSKRFEKTLESCGPEIVPFFKAIKVNDGSSD